MKALAAAMLIFTSFCSDESRLQTDPYLCEMMVEVEGGCIHPNHPSAPIRSGELYSFTKCERLGWVYTDHGCFDPRTHPNYAPEDLASPHR